MFLRPDRMRLFKAGCARSGSVAIWLAVLRVPQLSQERAGNRIAGIDAQSAFQIGLRPARVAFAHENKPEAPARLIIVWTQPQDGFVLRLRVGEAALSQINASQAAMSLVVVGTKPHGLAQMRHRIVNPPQKEQRVAEPQMGFG